MNINGLYMGSLASLWIYFFGVSTLAIAQDKVEDSIDVVADSRYDSKNIEDFFMGHHYRDAWLATVKFPYIDLDIEGLVPMKKGGGVQTTSLRLKRSDGTQYVFRSVKKDVSKKLPALLHNTLAQDILQDQISATHPYGALVIPRLAKGAGVSHSMPMIGVVRDSPDLGEFRETFGNMLVLYEQRPYGDLSTYPNYDFAPKVTNTPTVLEKTRKSLKNRVDEKAMARARLFDFWLGDIDRHEDQWRWGVFASDKGVSYRPIPRDRDFAFMKADGLIPWLGSRKWAFRMAMNFDYEIKDVAGLGMQGMYVDRNFLTQLTKSEWRAIAQSMQAGLSDDVIEEAFMAWPAVIREIDAEELKAKLKSRREHLVEYAEEYYEVLAEQVDVLGSEKRELFLIERLSAEETKVQVFHLKNDNERGTLYYTRVFKTNETKEIRVYGFGGDDKFEVTGNVTKGILIRIIGGIGADKITDNSTVKGSGKHTYVYDKSGEVEIIGGKETKTLTRLDSTANAYDRRAHSYDVWMPIPTFGYNVDDGFYIGTGVLWKHQGFRKKPFAWIHKLSGAFAVASSAFVAEYSGTFTDVVGKGEFKIEAQSVFPHYTSNFYGFGNESQVGIGRSQNYYVLRYNLMSIRPYLHFHTKNNRQSFQVGVMYKYVDVVEDGDKYVTSTDAQVSVSDLSSRHFSGFWASYTLHQLDHEASPNKGWRWKSWGGWTQRLTGSGGLGRLGGELNIYLPIKPIGTVLAMRFGGATIVNDYEFYQANSLGGQPMTHNDANLRGFRRDRFVGRTMAYQNTEIRTRLAQLPNYILPFELGLIAFIDHGRVWIDGEESATWHQGYGGGFTMSPSRSFTIQLTYDLSIENEFFVVTMGYRF